MPLQAHSEGGGNGGGGGPGGNGGSEGGGTVGGTVGATAGGCQTTMANSWTEPSSGHVAKASQAARKRMLSALLSSFISERSGAAGILFADMGAGERSGAAGILFADMGAERQRKPRTRCRRTCRT